MDEHRIIKIVSGGQTGVDQAALDVAITNGLDHGGWCPAGRRSEDGVIPLQYRLTETETSDYAIRTRRNVVESDGTLILFQAKISGGTQLTRRLALRHARPFIEVDLAAESFKPLITDVRNWIMRHNIGTLNVAGPRASNAPGIRIRAESFLTQCLDY